MPTPSLVGFINIVHVIETVTTNGCTYDTVLTTDSCAACKTVLRETRSPYMGHASVSHRFAPCGCSR